jgi:hypothetical protein
MSAVFGGVSGAGIAPATVDAATAKLTSLAAPAVASLAAPSVSGRAAPVVASLAAPSVAAPADAPATGNGDAVFGAKSTLGLLTRLSSAHIAEYVQTHPDAVNSLLVSPPQASRMANEWFALSRRVKNDLISGAPGLIGNLDGVPFAARSRANDIQLHRIIADIGKRLRGELGKGVRLQLQRQLRTLQEVRQAASTPAGHAKRSLVILDVGRVTRAAVAIGDLSTASYISYLVPGMYFSVDQQVEDWTATADELHSEQQEWLRRSFGCRACSGTIGVATVAWIGYQTPGLLDVGGLQLAREGAAYLEHGLQAVRALRAGDEPYITVIAHSYGSTAALMALERHSVHVDALALLGSPGSDAQSVRDLDVPPGDVFVAQAGLDPVVHTAFFGSDPGAPSYGATKMGVTGAIDPFGGHPLSASTGHNGYFEPGSECMRNLALIGIGKPDLVITAGKAATQLADGHR